MRTILPSISAGELAMVTGGVQGNNSMMTMFLVMAMSGWLKPKGTEARPHQVAQRPPAPAAQREAAGAPASPASPTSSAAQRPKPPSQAITEMA